MTGRHYHDCINPAGVSYHIDCFRKAPGCRLAGEAHSEHSWFPGCSWQCALHLGWYFQGAPSFHGLIPARLGKQPVPGAEDL